MGLKAQLTFPGCMTDDNAFLRAGHRELSRKRTWRWVMGMKRGYRQVLKLFYAVAVMQRKIPDLCSRKGVGGVDAGMSSHAAASFERFAKFS